MKESNVKVVAKNRKARFNYEILETYEAGIELKGTEVKSVRASKVNLTEGFISIDNGEAFLIRCVFENYCSTREKLRNSLEKQHRKVLLWYHCLCISKTEK